MKYVQVINWSAKGDSIHLEMLGEDQEVHSFDVGADCAGVLVGALAAEVDKLTGRDKELQLIRPTGMQTGKTAEDEPILFMSIKGGAELPFVFKREILDVLIAELQKLKGVLGGGGSDVRWR